MSSSPEQHDYDYDIKTIELSSSPQQHDHHVSPPSLGKKQNPPIDYAHCAIVLGISNGENACKLGSILSMCALQGIIYFNDFGMRVFQPDNPTAPTNIYEFRAPKEMFDLCYYIHPSLKEQQHQSLDPTHPCVPNAADIYQDYYARLPLQFAKLDRVLQQYQHSNVWLYVRWDNPKDLYLYCFNQQTKVVHQSKNSFILKNHQTNDIKMADDFTFQQQLVVDYVEFKKTVEGLQKENFQYVKFNIDYRHKEWSLHAKSHESGKTISFKLNLLQYFYDDDNDQNQKNQDQRQQQQNNSSPSTALSDLESLEPFETHYFPVSILNCFTKQKSLKPELLIIYLNPDTLLLEIQIMFNTAICLNNLNQLMNQHSTSSDDDHHMLRPHFHDPNLCAYETLSPFMIHTNYMKKSQSSTTTTIIPPSYKKESTTTVSSSYYDDQYSENKSTMNFHHHQHHPTTSTTTMTDDEIIRTVDADNDNNKNNLTSRKRKYIDDNNNDMKVIKGLLNIPIFSKPFYKGLYLIGESFKRKSKGKSISCEEIRKGLTSDAPILSLPQLLFCSSIWDFITNIGDEEENNTQHHHPLSTKKLSLDQVKNYYNTIEYVSSWNLANQTPLFWCQSDRSAIGSRLASLIKSKSGVFARQLCLVGYCSENPNVSDSNAMKTFMPQKYYNNNNNKRNHSTHQNSFQGDSVDNDGNDWE